VDPKKINSMMEYLIPKTLRNLRGFLGLTGYYHNFSKNYGQLVAYLMTLLKKEAFSWTQEAIRIFEKLEDAMCTTPILFMPDFTKTFIMECDSLGHRIGAILVQEGRTFSFESDQLKGKKLLKPIYAKGNVGHIACS
jgi:hypothetical protein